MPQVKNNKILIVESNARDRRRLSNFLVDLGFDIVETESCIAAIDIALAELPMMIFLDLSLCDAEEIDGVSAIRKHAELTAIPILASSPDGQHGIELFINIERFGPGKIEYLPKPLSLTQVEFYLKEWIPQMSATAG